MQSSICTRADAVLAGERQYFTGIPCKRGHLAPRMVANRLCVECNKSSCASWHLENKAATNAKRAIWTANNRERHSKNCQAWRRRNLEKFCAWESRRRAAKRSSPGQWGTSDVARLKILQRGKCAACKSDLTDTGHHIDHIVPLALGGSNGAENIQILCPPCNHRKSAKHPIAWRQSLGFLL